MEFHRRNHKPVTVPIVPLIDILVTLLFFFIVSMNDLTEKTEQPEIHVELPSANSLAVKVVSVTRSTLSLGKDGRAEIDGLDVPDGLLKQFLIANLEKRPGMKLALRVDRGCPWEKVIESHSAALDAGYAQGDIYYPVKSTDVPASEPPKSSP